MQFTTSQMPESGENFPKSQQSLGPLLPANLILAVVIFALNNFVVHHYYPQKGKFVPSMYMLISTADNLATILLLAQYFVLWLIDQHYLNDIVTAYLVTLLVAATGIFEKISVFSNVVLSVTRTIKIKRPFQRISRRIAFMSITGYGTFWAVLALADVVILVGIDDMTALDTFMTYPWLGTETVNLLAEAGCNEDCHREMLARSIQFSLLALAYLLPVLIVVACMVIQVLWVRRPRDVGAAGPNNQRHVTITILQLTVLFFFCHCAATVWFLCTDFINEETSNLPMLIPSYSLINGAIYTTLPLLNAAVSPVIIIGRGKDLRKSFKSLCVRLCVVLWLRRELLLN